MKFAALINTLLLGAAFAVSPPLRGLVQVDHRFAAEPESNSPNGHAAFLTLGHGSKSAGLGGMSRFAQPGGSGSMWLYGGITLALVAAGVIAFLVLKGKGGAASSSSTGSPDTGIVLAPRFKVPQHRMHEFKRGFTGFSDVIQPESEGMLYYGFSVDEANSVVMCREAYKNAEGLLTHLGNVDSQLKAALQIGALASLEVSGPEAELDKLKEALTPLGCKFLTLDSGSKVYSWSTPTSWGPGEADTSCLLVPHFKVPEGKMEEFTATFAAFYSSIKPQAEAMLYYGFAVDEENDVVLCREAYQNADGLLAHLDNVGAALQKGLEIASLESLEIHGPAGELEKLRERLTPLGCKFFVADGASKTWMQGAAVIGEAPAVPAPEPADEKQVEAADEEQGAQEVDTDVAELLQVSANRMVEQLQAKLDKGSRAREIVESRANSFTDKAKDFVINELNATASALLKAIDAEEATMLLDFNQAVEASFPPVAVLVAGVTSPAILTLSFAIHVVQLLVLFLPIFVASGWSLYEDFGTVCSIPTMQAWIWAAFVISFLQVVGHGILASKLSSGRGALQAKTKEISDRLQANAADGETDISDMQEIFIGSTVLVQEALILEDSIRKSPLNDVIGISNLLWVIAVIWNFVIVIGWTFVPGTIAFHEKAHDVAAGDFCGSWASVFTARVVCLLTPLFFFLNIAAVVQWVLVKVVHSKAVAGAVLGAAEKFDNGNAGIPVAQTLVKAFLLRASPDSDKAKLTVSLGEALRLSKQKADLEQQLESVQARINAGKLERKGLKTAAIKQGDSMEANIEVLEKAGEEDTAAWKVKGAELAKAAEDRAAASQKVVTEELDKIVGYVTQLAEQVQNSEMVKEAIVKAQKTAEDAKVAAAKAQEAATEGLHQAQDAASSGLAKAQSGLEAGVAYAQSDEAQAKLAQAKGMATAKLAEAQSGLEAGVAYAQSDEAQAALTQAASSGMASASQAAVQAQEAAQKGVAQAKKAAKKYNK